MVDKYENKVHKYLLCNQRSKTTTSENALIKSSCAIYNNILFDQDNVCFDASVNLLSLIWWQF